MQQRKPEAYLWDILRAIQAIEQFEGLPKRDDTVGEALLQTAIERKLEIIGEAMRQMEDRFPGSTAQLPEVKAATGMRNWLAHGYFAVQPDILWNTVNNQLPTLKSTVQRLLADKNSAD